MSSEIQKFLIKISLVSIALIVVGFIVFKWFLADYYLPVYSIALVLFYAFTVCAHAWQLNLAKKNLAKFARMNMVATFLKLIVYAAFIVIYLSVSTEKAIAFVIVVMILYIVYTTVEVASLTKFIRTLNQKSKD
ncbi:MAG: hypothetical protein HQ541_10295 [Mariniphaga sp.]|nr:hypothetical protein [Mariniphaga sp.]